MMTATASENHVRKFISSRIEHARKLHVEQSRLIHEVMELMDENKLERELIGEIVAFIRHENENQTAKSLTDKTMAIVKEEYRE